MHGTGYVKKATTMHMDFQLFSSQDGWCYWAPSMLTYQYRDHTLHIGLFTSPIFQKQDKYIQTITDIYRGVCVGQIHRRHWSSLIIGRITVSYIMYSSYMCIMPVAGFSMVRPTAGLGAQYSSPSNLRPPLIIRPLDLVPNGNFLC